MELRVPGRQAMSPGAAQDRLPLLGRALDDGVRRERGGEVRAGLPAGEEVRDPERREGLLVGPRPPGRDPPLVGRLPHLERAPVRCHEREELHRTVTAAGPQERTAPPG